MTSQLPSICEDELRSTVIDFGRYAIVELGTTTEDREDLSETFAQLVKYSETAERPDAGRVAALCDRMYAHCIAKHKAAGCCDPIDRLMLDRARWLAELRPGPMPHWPYKSVREAGFSIDIDFAHLERWRTYIFLGFCGCGHRWCIAVITPVWIEAIARRHAALALPDHDCDDVVRIAQECSDPSPGGTVTKQSVLAGEFLRRASLRGADPVGPVFVTQQCDEVPA